MKKLVLFLLVSVLAVGVQAQGKGKPKNKVSKDSTSAAAKTGREEKKEKARKTPEEIADKRADKLKTELGLSDEQRTRVRAAVLDKNTRFKAVKAQYKDSANKKGMGAQLKLVRDDFHAAMNGILSPEQKAKYEALRKKDKEDDNENAGDDDSSSDNQKGKEDLKPEKSKKAKKAKKNSQ